MDFCLDGVRQISTLTTEYIEHETGKTLISFHETLCIGNKDEELFRTKHETYYNCFKEFYENITYTLPSLDVLDWIWNESGFSAGKLYNKFFGFLEDYLSRKLRRKVDVTISNDYMNPAGMCLKDNSLFVIIKTASPFINTLDFKEVKDKHTVTLYVLSTNPEELEYTWICDDHTALYVAELINDCIKRFRRLVLMD